MGKKILLDLDLCVGCGACSVACMDQNDIEPDQGEPAYRRIFQMEMGKNPDASFQYISTACRHCDDSPCLVGCPTGAISKDLETDSIVVNRDVCIGCHSCALACPFGIPRYDNEDKLYKCTQCYEREQAGLKPACVRVCPMSALQFDLPNVTMKNKELDYLKKSVNEARQVVQGDGRFA